MLRRLNKLIKLNVSGQVAIILIFVIAIALIMFAIVLNLGKITQTKTQLTIAANMGGSILASQMASYGQSKFMGELGGERERCELSGLARLIVGIIVIVIAIATMGAGLVLIIVVAALALGAIGLRALAVEPGIDRMFNKDIGLMSQTGQFLEQGIKAALQAAVSDSERASDAYDLDADRLFGNGPNGPRDTISRFSVYYNQRMKSITGPDPAVVLNFLLALDQLLYEGTDAWGLYDPVGCNFSCCYDPVNNPAVPSECNECCYPATTSIYSPSGVTSVPLRDVRCDDPLLSFGISTTCGQSPISPFGTGYPWVYDPHYENPTNGFVSFREQLGRDDEHRDFVRDINNIGLDPIEQISDSGRGFIIEDTTGYLNFDLNPGPLFGGRGFGTSCAGLCPDRRRGIHSFFYKIRDWGIDLASLAPSATLPAHCYWYEAIDPTCNPIISSSGYPPELFARQLSLTNPPASLVYNTANRVDGLGDPFPVDRITVPDYIVSEDVDPNYCAQQTLYPVPKAGEGFWKSGGDQYCSVNWPYEQQCPKHGTWTSPTSGPCQEPGGTSRDCICGEAGAGGADMWPDDTLDEIIYGLPQFFEVALMYLPQRGSNLAAFQLRAAQLARDLERWYPTIAEWIEPGTRSGAVQSASSPLPCVMCEQEDGWLWQWMFNLTQMRNRLQSWLTESYAGAACDTVWCSPEASLSCSLIKPDERSIMLASTIPDVINCLSHNIQAPGPMGGTGNAGRFQDCYDECEEAVIDPTNPAFPLGSTQDFIDTNTACGDNVRTFLPRSLVAGFDPSADFVPADMVSLTPYTDCPGNCNGCISTCSNNYNACTNLCNSALAACGSAPSCTTAYNQCMNDPSPVGCEPTYDQCLNGCLCNTPSGTFQCCTLDAVSGTYSGTCPDPNLYITLNNIVEPLGYKGSCVPSEFALNSGLFFDLVNQSIPEAENQVDKFRQRREFLRARVNEINAITAIMDRARAELDAFLRGPAAELIKQRLNVTGELPPEVIYGWQDDPPPGNPSGPGLWHIVKVEARIPGRCNSCDASQTRSIIWPTTRTRTKSWGMQRCIFLADTDGVVKLRVTRYDENRPTNPLFFPNGAPIWDFRSHPSRSPLNTAINIDVTDCPPFVGPNGPYTGAFLVNGPNWISNLPSDNNACWTRADDLLINFGVTSETCARYYLQEGNWAGFDFQFVPCGPFN